MGFYPIALAGGSNGFVDRAGYARRIEINDPPVSFLDFFYFAYHSFNIGAPRLLTAHPRR